MQFFLSLKDRIRRALDLGLFSLCLNNNHKMAECPGTRGALPFKCVSCDKPEHHGALCPKVLTKTHSSGIMNCQFGFDVFVPIISLEIKRKNGKTYLPFLLDT